MPSETRCLSGVLIYQYFPQDDKCPANKKRQLSSLCETRAFSQGCGRAWLVDVSQEAGGAGGGWEEERPEGLDLISFYADFALSCGETRGDRECLGFSSKQKHLYSGIHRTST